MSIDDDDYKNIFIFITEKQITKGIKDLYTWVKRKKRKTKQNKELREKEKHVKVFAAPYQILTVSTLCRVFAAVSSHYTKTLDIEGWQKFQLW